VRTRVRRWGNSLAVRIPKGFAQEVGLVEGGTVGMRLEEGRLVLEPLAEQGPTLDELLEGVTDANRHGEAETGPAVGGEAW
jgi:antitoxin MazE